MAKAFMHKYGDCENIVIFASGVAHSKDTNQNAFRREEDLFRSCLTQYKNSFFVYFSTCSMYDPQQSETPYVIHKLHMEKVLEECGGDYLICRVSNVVGHTENRLTVFNFLVDSIRCGNNFALWRNAIRNLIDVDDVVVLVDYIISNKCSFPRIVNIANPNSYAVTELVDKMETYFGCKGHYSTIDAGLKFEIDVSTVSLLCEKLALDFQGPYIQRLLRKYYPHTGDEK